MFTGRYFAKRYFTGRYWTPASGIYVQLGGFGQVIGFGMPTLGIGGGPLLIEVPSLSTLIGFGLPTVGFESTSLGRLFVRATASIWRVISGEVWRS